MDKNRFTFDLVFALIVVIVGTLLCGLAIVVGCNVGIIGAC